MDEVRSSTQSAETEAQPHFGTTRSAPDLIQTTSRLVELLDQQLSVLRRIDQRQAATDFSQQPIPEVPATSSSAWNALLQSTLKETIDPRVERWRSGLDALLVFLGLFSAIVTTFLVNSLAGLEEDQTARTNELLVNLTEILISLSGKPASGLNLTYPAPFTPASGDVRVNAFWSVSLTLSLTIAALALGCRGFLNMATWSRHKRASERLADIWTRWNGTNRVLRPVIEALPQLLIFPVFLFILGILDLLISTVNGLLHPPVLMLSAFSVSVICIVVVASFLCFTVVDASIHPASSPFQSKVAYSIHTLFLPHVRRYLGGRPAITVKDAARTPSAQPAGPRPLPAHTMDLYHSLVQLTHEDERLDDAAAAVFNVIRDGAGSSWHDKIHISAQECMTLRHLLSPEASIRSNRTAAWALVRFKTVDPRKSIIYAEGDFWALLQSLVGAAKRSGEGYDLATLWDSLFIRAMAVLLLAEDRDSNEHPLVLLCLTSKHASWDEARSRFETASSMRRRQSVFSFLLDVLYAKLHKELPSVSSETDARIVDLLLSPRFTLSAAPVSLSTYYLTQSLIYRPPGDQRRELTHILRWSMKVTTPPHIVARYLDILDALSAAQIRAFSWTQCGSLFLLVDTVARLCLEMDSSASEGTTKFEVSWEPVSDLCATCLVKFITFRDRLSIAAFPFDLVLTLLHVARHFPLDVKSRTFQFLPAIHQYVRETPHSRYPEVLAEFQALLDIVGDKSPAFQRHTFSSQDEIALVWKSNRDDSELVWKTNQDTADSDGASDV